MYGEKQNINKIGKIGASTVATTYVHSIKKEKKNTLITDVEKTPFQVWDEKFSLS